jgi:hypothetical protein
VNDEVGTDVIKYSLDMGGSFQEYKIDALMGQKIKVRYSFTSNAF